MASCDPAGIGDWLKSYAVERYGSVEFVGLALADVGPGRHIMVMGKGGWTVKDIALERIARA